MPTHRARGTVCNGLHAMWVARADGITGECVDPEDVVREVASDFQVDVKWKLKIHV